MKQLLVTILILLISNLAFSANQIAGSDQFKNQSYKTLTVEISLPYLLKEYADPIAIHALPSKKSSDFSTPESAVQTFFSSILATDAVWNRDCWTEDANKFNDRVSQINKHDDSYWRDIWKKLYAGKTIQLISRIDYDKYVLVEYRVLVAGASAPIEQATLTLVRVNDKWLLTQELAKNPILFSNKTATGRIQVGASMLNTAVTPQDIVPSK